MDAEEIAKLVAGLRVSAERKERVVKITSEEAERGQKRIERVVVGKIFSRKSVNRETLRLHLPRILRSRGSTEIEVVGHNLFVISFSLEADKRIALEEGPWHFFQDLVIFKQTQAMQTPTEVEFEDITLWVQCHNVPLECMDPTIIRRIGGQIGAVEEVDVGEDGMCTGKFARVRVTRRIDEPLLRCIPLVHEELNKEVLVLLQYEKLPDFCFACGRVGHISRDCGDLTVDKGEYKYESWLRAGRTSVGRRVVEAEISSTSRREIERGREGRRFKEGEKEGVLEIEEGGEGDSEDGPMINGGLESLREGSGLEGDNELGGQERGESLMEEDEGGEEMVETEKESKEIGMTSSQGQNSIEERQLRIQKGRKGWKRLARIKRGGEMRKDGKEGEGSDRGEGLKRRGVPLGERGEEDGPKQKCRRSTGENVIHEETVAAALQPRRTL